MHDSVAKDLLFRLIHNIIPNRQRLFRMNKCSHQYCLEEVIEIEVQGPLNEGIAGRDGMKILGGEVEDNTHLFAQCVKVGECWHWLRSRILDLLPLNSDNCSDWELLHLTFPEHIYEDTILWLISSYCEIVWTNEKRGMTLTLKKMLYELKERYWCHQRDQRVQLTHINF